ncbi:Y-family DNA polymerase [Mycoplasmopsis gallopavonis]|uniref:DNA polymerase IV n=1 Tax=Mycoplasmopsis gallopavonis TaxID=76629 RepID=A0A449AZT9_9BACT|nr:DNA polymerase IV [Mycoplasmopsis gallopavonis]RIV16908.1 DNA polymerase IV [Mycoplasmopsis gallopavonis]VEU73012.1 DNA polymerase IV [Mycoplasmopsis gallopavonis]
MKNSVILHIDFDSYFVSALRTIRPELKNKPVVCAKTKSNSIILSMSYELKKYGIKAGALVSDLRKLEPNLIVAPPIYELFSTLSKNIFGYFFKNVTQRFEAASIDECYLDISDLVPNLESGLTYARNLQNLILQEFDIPISIGVASNKFLAKMTTNLVKPFNVGLADETNYQTLFYDLPISKFHGIGRRSLPKLEAIGIYQIKDLVSKSPLDLNLRNIFGRNTAQYLELINPKRQERIALAQKEDPKGIGKEITFELEELNQINIDRIIKEIIDELVIRLKSKNLATNNLTLVVRNLNKKWISKNKKLPEFTQDPHLFYIYAKQLFNDNFDEYNIRGLGIRFSNLENINTIFKPISLLEDEKLQYQKISEVDRLIAKVNHKIGKNSTMTLNQYQSNKRKNSENQTFEIDGIAFQFKK